MRNVDKTSTVLKQKSSP
ncbi:TPA: 23S rRNA methyltransferase attenuation leader peptide [Enterococcus faecium]